MAQVRRKVAVQMGLFLRLEGGQEVLAACKEAQTPRSVSTGCNVMHNALHSIICIVHMLKLSLTSGGSSVGSVQFSSRYDILHSLPALLPSNTVVGLFMPENS